MDPIKTPHLPVRAGWLALHEEPVIDPGLPIVDAHHHLWDRPGDRYLADELLADTGSGHNIVATVFVQCRSMLRAGGPAALKTVGEVEFVNGVAAMGRSGIYGATRICDAIVGGADLTATASSSEGVALETLLESMIAVSGGRLRGIRNPVVWHPDPRVKSSPAVPPADLMLQSAFRRGVATLAKYGLSLDVWAYHSQLDELYALAKSVPEVPVIINHFGGPVGVGPYADALPEMRAAWKAGLAQLATLPNTVLKLGGAGMPVFGFPFGVAARPPSSQQLADAWRPYFETSVDLFGASRCLFESNFPVDKGMFSYAVFWNACKRLAEHASGDERDALFRGTATRVYKL